MKIFRFARAAFCPTKSSSDCGRMVVSISSPRFSAEMRRSASLMNEAPCTQISHSNVRRDILIEFIARMLARQFLEPEADQRSGVRRLAGRLQSRSNGVGRHVARVTKIGKCRYCVRDRSRGNALPKLLLETDRASCITRERWSLGLQFRDDSLGHLLANARRARNHGYVAQCDGVSQFGRRKGRKNAKCNLRANALNIAHQQAEPFTLQRRAEPIEPNRILTHIGFDEERRCGSCTIQRSERARRTM